MLPVLEQLSFITTQQYTAVKTISTHTNSLPGMRSELVIPTTQSCVQPRGLPQGVRSTQQRHHGAHNSWRRESPREGHQRPTACSNERHAPNAKRSENRGARNLLAVAVEPLVELSSRLGFQWTLRFVLLLDPHSDYEWPEKLVQRPSVCSPTH